MVHVDLLLEFGWLNECLVQRKKFLRQSRELSIAAFHARIEEKVQAGLTNIGTTLARRLLVRLIDANFKDPQLLLSQNDVGVTDEEKDIVCYIGGFVLFKMKQDSFRLKEGELKTDKLAIVEALTSEQVCSLVEIKSRGGLLGLTDGVLAVFTRLECAFRIQTQNHLVAEINVSELVTALCLDEKLTKLFFDCLEDVSASKETKENFLASMMKVYFYTRCNGFCRQVMERYRRDRKSSKRAKSLRKSLGENENY